MHRRLRAQPARARCGFTLLELLVVMILIVIAFFAARPSFTGVIRGAEDRNAIRQVVSLLVAARAQAVGTGKLVRVVYDAAEQTFTAQVQPDPAEDRQRFETIRLVGRRQLRLPDHLVLAEIEVAGFSMTRAGTSLIYFYPDGRTDGANIEFVKSSGDTVWIEVAPATGRVKLSV